MSASFKISQDLVGQRLDQAVAAINPNHSRSEIEKLIKSGKITINGQSLRSSYRVKLNDKVKCDWPKIEPSLVAAAEAAVLYSDQDVLVVNKPPDVRVHPVTAGQPSLVGNFADQLPPDGSLRPGVVHRLDRDTSGVIILAKNLLAQLKLKRQFARRGVIKEYLALVVGSPTERTARINLPLARDLRGGTRQRVQAGGRSAITEYEVVDQFQGYSLLKVRPLTGRTHQIRVHLTYLGCPIAGDTVYGAPQRPAGLHRQFLHASSLKLKLPSGNVKTFHAPLAPDLQSFLNTLKVA